jgi:hypothetical protein
MTGIIRAVDSTCLHEVAFVHYCRLQLCALRCAENQVERDGAHARTRRYAVRKQVRIIQQAAASRRIESAVEEICSELNRRCHRIGCKLALFRFRSSPRVRRSRSWRPASGTAVAEAVRIRRSRTGPASAARTTRRTSSAIERRQRPLIQTFCEPGGVVGSSPAGRATKSTMGVS